MKEKKRFELFSENPQFGPRAGATKDPYSQYDKHLSQAAWDLANWVPENSWGRAYPRQYTGVLPLCDHELYVFASEVAQSKEMKAILNALPVTSRVVVDIQTGRDKCEPGVNFVCLTPPEPRPEKRLLVDLSRVEYSDRHTGVVYFFHGQPDLDVGRLSAELRALVGALIRVVGPDYGLLLTVKQSSQAAKTVEPFVLHFGFDDIPLRDVRSPYDNFNSPREALPC